MSIFNGNHWVIVLLLLVLALAGYYFLSGPAPVTPEGTPLTQEELDHDLYGDD